ncbi:protein rep [Actinomycetospora flava]|uniref:Protein rep n=1 Tax=Actinomycetospora flava TaxID=3129232 RepID=A0ABU8MHH9_9PSEU
MTAPSAAGRRRGDAAPLGNTTPYASAAGQDRFPDWEATAADGRSAARRGLATFTTRRRQAQCFDGLTTHGETRAGDGSWARLRFAVPDGCQAGSLGIEGVWRCGYWATCPECSAKIAAERAAELRDAIDVQLRHGDSVALLTLTSRHHSGMTLVDQVKAQRAAWRAIWKGRAGQDLRDEIEGYCRVWEATHGENGWHPHWHVLLFLPGAWTPEQTRALGEDIWQRYDAGLRAEGFHSLRDHGGLDIRLAGWEEIDPTALGGYLAKGVYADAPDVVDLVNNADRLALEAVAGAFKQARQNRMTGGRGRTPFVILEHLLTARMLGLDDTREATRDAALWREWERTHADMTIRQWTWSRARASRGQPSLRELVRTKAAAIGHATVVTEVERTEDEIVTDDAGSEPLMEVPEVEFHRVIKWEIEAMRHVSRDAGPLVVFAWLRQRGVAVRWCDDPSARRWAAAWDCWQHLRGSALFGT